MAEDIPETLSARYFLLDNRGGSDSNRPAMEAIENAHPVTYPYTKKKRARGGPLTCQASNKAKGNRLAQLRNAQRAYRAKKDAVCRDMQRRLQDAELNCDRLATSLAEFRNKAVQSDLHVTHPLLFQSLRDLVTLAEAAQGTDTDQQACQGGLEPKQRTHVDAPAKPSQNATSSFGYIVGCIADVSPGSHDDDHGPSP